MGATDYLEQYFATNIVFEPLVGELFRSRLPHAGGGAPTTTSSRPPVISAAEADYERNLANTIDLVHLLANDEQHAAAQQGAVPGLADEAAALAAARPPQPAADLVAAALKPVSFEDAQAQAKNRLEADLQRTRPRGP